MSRGGDSGASNRTFSPNIVQYQAPSFNDPHHPLNSAPVVDNSAVAGNNNSLLGGNMPTGNANILPGAPATHHNKHSNPVNGAGSSTVIASNYYSGYAPSLRKEKRLNIDPSSFVLNPQQAQGQYNNNNQMPQGYNYSGSYPPQSNQPNGYPYGTPPQPSSSNYNQAYMAPPAMPAIPGQPTPNQAYSQQTTAPNGGPGQLPIDQPPQPTYGNIDYLNYIAPDTPRKSGFGALSANPLSSKLFMAIGGGVIALVIIVSVIAAVGGSKQNGPSAASLTQLGQDIANLQGVTQYGEDAAEDFNTNISNVNAEISLTSKSQFKILSGKIDIAATDKDGNTVEPTASEDIKNNLDKAKSQGVLDSSFKKELQSATDKVVSDIKEIYNSTDNEETKKLLETAYNDYSELSNRIKSVN